MWLDDVQGLRNSFDFQDKDWVETEQLKKDIKAQIARNSSAELSLDLFNRIASWKLGRQEGRTRRFRTKVTNDFVRKITNCAFSLVHADRESLTRVRLNVIQGIQGVGMGIASAVLALTFPEQYGVIDDRVWKVIYAEDKESFSLSDYHKYLDDLLAGATQLNWLPQELDFFAWKLGEYRSSIPPKLAQLRARAM
jgi:hypothetical protein